MHSHSQEESKFGELVFKVKSVRKPGLDAHVNV